MASLTHLNLPPVIMFYTYRTKEVSGLNIRFRCNPAVQGHRRPRLKLPFSSRPNSVKLAAKSLPSLTKQKLTLHICDHGTPHWANVKLTLILLTENIQLMWMYISLLMTIWTVIECLLSPVMFLWLGGIWSLRIIFKKHTKNTHEWRNHLVSSVTQTITKLGPKSDSKQTQLNISPLWNPMDQPWLGISYGPLSICFFLVDLKLY